MRPGFLEADMVAHCGTNIVGGYLYTLTLTDVATGWTECLPVELTAGEDFWRSNAGDQPENRAWALLLPSQQGEDSFWEESKAAVIPA